MRDASETETTGHGLRFDKVEGLGNDFVLVAAATDEGWEPGRVKRVCDRRFGIGADGVLLVLPPRSGGAARMKVINADGSVPEMCGNGLRCVALWLAAEDERPKAELLIETDAGSLAAVVERHGDEAEVDVDMGLVRVVGERTIRVGGDSYALILADAGNPHAIAYREDPEADLPRVGLALATHPSFPEGTNVELVRWKDGVIEVAVWERGAGRTLACGTGACAVAAVARARGELKADQPVVVRLPGGDLQIRTELATGRTRMRGPARLVFRGEWRG